MNKFLLLLFLFLFTLTGKAYSQCCAAGNPQSNDMDFSHTGKNSLSAGISYRYSLSDAIYAGDSKMQIGFIDHTRFHYTEAMLRYGISRKIFVRAEMGYFISKGEYYQGGIDPAVGYGLGDLSLTAGYQVFPRTHRIGELVAGIGCKLPIGVFDQEVDNVKLPVNVQPSSGSYKLSGFLYHRKALSQRLSVFSTISGEYASRIQSVNFHYRYGNSWQFSPGLMYTIKPGFFASFACKAESWGNATRDDSIKVKSSGGRLIALYPSFSYKAGKSMWLNMGFSLPVYRYMNGIQPANTYGAQVSLVFRK